VRIVERYDLVASGEFPGSSTWADACWQVERAIAKVDWPHGSGQFTIYPQSGKRRGEGNGVVPIKVPCISALREAGWITEDLPQLPDSVLRPGDLDALLVTPEGNVGFEWETGNISSSHRAINKLLLTLQWGGIRGGILVVPSEDLRQYLTDRIGNITELRCYFPLWRCIPFFDAALRIIVVEHDAVSTSVPRIPKGTDGRAQG
jgi:hypothetical protein